MLVVSQQQAPQAYPTKGLQVTGVGPLPLALALARVVRVVRVVGVWGRAGWALVPSRVPMVPRGLQGSWRSRVGPGQPAPKPTRHGPPRAVALGIGMRS